MLNNIILTIQVLFKMAKELFILGGFGLIMLTTLIAIIEIAIHCLHIEKCHK